MTPQQLATVLANEGDIFPFKCKSILISSVFARDDLSKDCFKRLIEKLLDANFDLDIPKIPGIMDEQEKLNEMDN